MWSGVVLAVATSYYDVLQRNEGSRGRYDATQPDRSPSQEGLPTVTEEEILSFVSSSITSTWELELILLLYNSPEQSWSRDQLNRELRASQEVIRRAVRNLRGQGLILETEGNFSYARGDDRRDTIINELRILCNNKPITVFNAISSAQAARLKTFSDAFRFRE